MIRALDHAIINLLNNAADASPENIRIEIQLDRQSLRWQIADQGEGIADDVSSILGKETVSTLIGLALVCYCRNDYQALRRQW